MKFFVHHSPRRRPFYQAAGFTLIELLVVIAIIAILAAILFPVFSRARENARRSSCQSNLKQIGIGIAQYSQDYDEKFPAVLLHFPNGHGDTYSYTANFIEPYIKSEQVWICPSAPPAPSSTYRPYKGFPSYGVNILLATAAGDGISIAAINNTAELVQAVEATYPPSGANWPGYFAAWYNYLSTPYASYNNNVGQPWPRHFEGANALYADGHVKWQKVSTLTTAPAVPANWRLWYPSAP